MEFSEFQSRAASTDVTGAPIVAVLGLAGEIGSLYAVYKKRLRDKLPIEQFRVELAEELGDVLWYISTVATANKIDLERVAQENLKKTNSFFGHAESPFFDEFFPESERLPDRMRVEFALDDNGRSQMTYIGLKLGDSLSDNSHTEDKYRFHDAFHLAFLAHLHWSPVMRRLLKRKRKSNILIDENEDGARAAIVEEAVVAIIFTYAEAASFYPELHSIPHKLVALIQKMTANFEVSQCSAAAWRRAIYDGCRAFEQLRQADGGIIEIDMRTATLTME